MTIGEAKAAFYHRIPVSYEGTIYPYIQAMRYQQHEQEPIIQLELLDQNHNSVVLAPPGKTALAGELPAPKPDRDGETMYEWQGVRMILSQGKYITSTQEHGPVRATENKLTAWTSFLDLLDSRVRRQIGEELAAQRKDRYTGKEGIL